MKLDTGQTPKSKQKEEREYAHEWMLVMTETKLLINLIQMKQEIEKYKRLAKDISAKTHPPKRAESVNRLGGQIEERNR